MKTLPTKTFHSSSAFSLIEVVLALAICGVGLITIIGLFPQGLTSARNASDDSISSMVAQDTIAYRRVLIQNGGAVLGTATAADTRWFSPEGKEIIVSNPTNATAAMYKCEVLASTFTGIPNLENTRVQVLYPWFRRSDATAKDTAKTNLFLTEIAQY